MEHDRHKPRGIRVPDGRITRLSRLSGMALGVAGNVAVNGGRQWLGGARPGIDRLLLTPSNVTRITKELARMRGAAMKMGQLLSMESGEVLSPELAEILGHLRNDAHFMPPRQLKEVLIRNWGPQFMKRFARFDVRPVAAASIGQVHRAQTKDGRDVAIKVQYPGVRRSIDSDVSNVAMLMRMSGLLPRALDLGPLLDEARRQLHEEADYAREGQMLAEFGDLLADQTHLHVPRLQEDLTTPDILGMSFAPGIPVDQLAEADQETRDQVAAWLIDLMLRELFEFGLMQTDPNFANYSYDAEENRVVLLDFGATRRLPETLAGRYRALFEAGMSGETEAALRAMTDIGFIKEDTAPHHREAIAEMFSIAMGPLRTGGVFDFAGSDLADRLRQKGMEFAAGRDFWVIPPADTLFVQRKIGGVFLLAGRLRARVDLDAIIDRIRATD
ncbi:ABC1 kinase family protein [Roseobacter ponti]|uniref:AarF/ABC1/UbiB kinase family protein n=1 Tax=Roseobacter ponti TaxID=1891787 RepID=A0A858STK7_9RHOB|nr:AarF/ABC1/UbiB kinase family protein [Roseobacter ponti]QJF51650.1 AarF/ABC1/UbiB kinase family protein [Roseobacter ponti]